MNGQRFAHHAPNFPSVNRDAPYRLLFHVTMLLRIISDLPAGNIIKCKWNIW